MPVRTTFLLFSGHNDRAVVALCRFFTLAKVDWWIVASGAHDPICRTHYRSQIIFSRLDKSVDVGLFSAIANAVEGRVVVCPTTEYINQFLLDHSAELDAVTGSVIDPGLPDRSVYACLTSKFFSQALIRELIGLDAPSALPWPPEQVPCVLKPRENVMRSEVLYPKLCMTENDLRIALRELDPHRAQEEWFAQKYVTGQSYYLCAYLTRQGEYAWFWQENLMQQAGGKSIVLARTCDNPGIDAARLFAGLIARGYRGPFMMEVIRDTAGALHYIEINPRFWGPLQLALNACPEILVLFLRDHGVAMTEPMPQPAVPAWYAWAYGALAGNCRIYPAAAADLVEDAARLLIAHDVYAAEDTLALHLAH